MAVLKFLKNHITIKQVLNINKIKHFTKTIVNEIKNTHIGAATCAWV